MRNVGELAVPSQDGCPSGFEKLVFSWCSLTRLQSVEFVRIVARCVKSGNKGKRKKVGADIVRFEKEAIGNSVGRTDGLVGDGRRYYVYRPIRKMLRRRGDS